MIPFSTAAALRKIFTSRRLSPRSNLISVITDVERYEGKETLVVTKEKAVSSFLYWILDGRDVV